MKEIKNLFMAAPDSQLDASMKPLIAKWSDPPTPLQILEVLDYCIFSALASGFMVTYLQLLYDTACKDNNTTKEEVAKGAHWRKEMEC